MADLSPVTSSKSGSDASGESRYAAASERGQIILVGGFVIAATLIALALVMNSAIYTQNLATQSDTSGAIDANAYQHAVEHGVADAVVYANEVNGSDHDGLARNVTQSVSTLGDISTDQEVTRGHVPNVSVANINNGTRIGYSGDDAFSSGDDSLLDGNNWTLASDVGNTTDFNIGVADWESLNTSDKREFRVVADGSSEWRMNVSKSGSRDVILGVSSGGTYSECTRTVGSTDDLWINVTDGTVAGSSCEALTFAEDVDSYDLEFQNASDIEGNYSMIVDQDVTDSDHYDSSDFDTNDVTYSTTVDVTYRTPELYYRTKHRVAPGETDG